MKKRINSFLLLNAILIVLITAAGFILTSCIGFVFRSGSNTLSISSERNISTVILGGTIRFTARGRNIVWSVSSTSDGMGSVSSGTYISSNGVLTVSLNETSTVIYIIITSSDSGESEFKPIRIVSVNGVSVSPANQTIRRGQTSQFSASVSGNNNPDNTVTWRVSSNSSGTGAVTPGTSISSNGLLTISSSETLPALYITATSAVDPSKSGSTAVSVIIPLVSGVSVSPANQSIIAGRTLQFYASVTGTNDPSTAVNWKVSSNAAGSGGVTNGTAINANGLLTVAPNERITTLFIFATSVEDPTKTGSVLVNVVVPTVSGVGVSPPNQTVSAGGTIQFNATVTGSNSPSNAVTWRVSSNANNTGTVTLGTSIDANGRLTVSANETATTLFVTATSQADPTKSGSVTVNVIVPVVSGVGVSPANQTVEAGGTLQLTASVVGSNNPSNAVSWRVSSNAAATGGIIRGTTISANGLLTVSVNETAAALYVTATSVADPSKSGSVIVYIRVPATPPPVTPEVPPPVTPPIATIPTVSSVTVTPANQTVQRGGNLQFSAAVTGTNNPATTVTWRVSSNAAGTGSVVSGTSINSSGRLTVSSNETATTLYVTAISTVDTTKSGSVTVNVPAPVPTVTNVTVSPANQTVQRGGNLQFSAAVTGTNNPATTVTWRVSSNAAGTGSVVSGTSINSSGRLTVSANETATTLYVTATSTVDTTKSGTVTVSVPAPVITPPPEVTPPPVVTPPAAGITITPLNPTVAVGSPLQLTATVTGLSNTRVSWSVGSNPDATGRTGNGTSINNNGRLTISANETASTLYVKATSSADSSVFVIIAVTVILRH